MSSFNRYRYNPRRSFVRPYKYVNHNRMLISGSAVNFPFYTITNFPWNVGKCERFFSTPPPLHKIPIFSDNSENDENYVYLNICWSFDDVKNHLTDRPIDPILSNYQYIKADFTVKDIQKKALESLDTIENLEYYNTETRSWFAITDIANSNNDGTIHASYTGRLLHIRLPDYYDSYEYGDVNDDFTIGNDYSDEEDDDGESDGGNDRKVRLSDGEMHRNAAIRYGNADRSTLRTLRLGNRNGNGVTDEQDDRTEEELMEGMIRDLLKRLKENAYERSKLRAMSLQNRRNNDEIPTKQWVHQECSNSTELQSIILSKANALKHIVQCLHYDFLWKKDK